jgi:CheY-like chemotaxis protein
LSAVAAPCVLVVEDEPAAREIVCESLEAEGCKVMGAADGGEAIRFLEGGARPCVILLDLMMPGVNGWKFRDWQRGSAHAAIPVVLLSAVRNLADEARKLDVAGYLEKPLKFPSLLESVHKHCGTCRQAS